MTIKLRQQTFGILMFLLSLPMISFSQQKKITTGIELQNVKEILETVCFNKISWKIQDNDNSTNSKFIINDIDDYITKWKPLDISLGIELRSKKTFELIKKYRNKFDSTFKDFHYTNAESFIYFHKIALPIHFGLFNNTELSLIFSSVVSDKVYNTLKLTPKQRASKAITTYILPALKIIANNFTTKEIKYIGISCVYGSKDFGDDDPNATKGEFVSFLAPSNLIKKYASNDISEEELVKAAEIYISDRDMAIHDTKKIQIIIE